jgi:hypothetical protein
MDGDAMAVRAARSAAAAVSVGAPRSVLGPGASATSAAEDGAAKPGPAPWSAAFSTLPYVASAPRAHSQASGNQHQNLRNILSDPASLRVGADAQADEARAAHAPAAGGRKGKGKAKQPLFHARHAAVVSRGVTCSVWNGTRRCCVYRCTASCACAGISAVVAEALKVSGTRTSPGAAMECDNPS